MPNHGRSVALVMQQGQVGGAERVLLELLAVTRPGPVVVCAPTGSPLADEVEILGHRVRDFSLPLLSEGAVGFAAGLAGAVRALAAVARHEDVALVHAFQSTTLKAAVPVALARHLPMVASVHDDTGTAGIGRAKSAMQRLLARRAVRVVAVSEYVRGTLVEAGYREEQVTVVRNGVGPRPAPSRPRRETRALTGIPDAAVVFALVGRIRRLKGQLVALAALERLCAAHPGTDVRLVLVGGPLTAGDEAYAAELAAAVAASPVRARVSMLGWRSDIEDIWELADVALVPSVEPDAFPTAVLEASRAGRPVLVSSRGGGREAVTDGVTGLVVDPTPESLAAAMDRALDPGWRAGAGASARRLVAERFSADAYARTLHRVWREAGGVSVEAVQPADGVASRARS